MDKARYERKAENDRKKILALTQEIEALRQLLDCAVANISLLVKEHGGERKLSKKDVSEALGKYSLSASRDEAGDYILKLYEEKR